MANMSVKVLKGGKSNIVLLYDLQGFTFYYSLENPESVYFSNDYKQIWIRVSPGYLHFVKKDELPIDLVEAPEGFSVTFEK